jgi:hypothetical protein
MNLTVTQLEDFPAGTQVRDRDGDIWTKQENGHWDSPETRSFMALTIVRKWSPISLVQDEPDLYEQAAEERAESQLDDRAEETARFIEKRRDFLKNYGVGPEGVQRFANIEAPTAFDLWWAKTWKNRTDTIQHTISRALAYEAWEAGRRSRG